MKVTWTWLAEWVDLPPTPEELARGLAMRGLPVESIEGGVSFDPGIVVGRVLEVLPHPNADRLRLCSVDIGSARLSIVCGASNVAVGQRVAVAQVGSRLPDGTKLRKSKIRGVESEGMICSERELALSAESEGIWVLPGDPPLGAPLGDILGGDPILDVEVTPNRTDCLSVRGLAREIASIRGTSLKQPRPLIATGSGALPTVLVENPEDCPRYMARVVHGLKVGPSPDWLRKRVEASGFRSINNVVDATNYVLRTHGQPIHAFDAERVRGNRIEVRRARAGEALTLLDGRRVTPGQNVLVIADAEGPMALAGIMGGMASGVTDGTTSVVLESAEFGPGVTRESARGLGIETDASLRFVQGVDPEGVPIALDDVARILSEIAGGEVVREVLDRWPGRKAPPTITLRLARARALLGIDVTPARAGSALAGLGIRQVDPWTGEGISATASFEVPSHRRDLELEVDLIEEVARVVGYDTIPSRLDQVSLGTSPKGSTRTIANDILTIACGIGFDELVNTALIGALPEAWTPAEGSGALWEVRNPKSKELRHLRPSLLPGLLAAAGRNLRHGAGEVRLVEAGKVFSALPPPLGSERLELALVLGGAPDSWSHPAADADRFLELKGSAESLLGSLGIDSPRTRPYHEPCWAPGTGIRFEHDEVALGRLGEVAGEIRALLQIDRRLWAAAFDLAAVERAIPARRQYRAIHRFPPSKRDLALVVGQDVPYAGLVEAIGSAGGSLLHQVRLFDVFEGPQVGAGKKSLAFALEFRAADRTLSDKEVDETVERIVKDLAARFGASRRGGVVEPARAGQPIA